MEKKDFSTCLAVRYFVDAVLRIALTIVQLYSVHARVNKPSYLRELLAIMQVEKIKLTIGKLYKKVVSERLNYNSSRNGSAKNPRYFAQYAKSVNRTQFSAVNCTIIKPRPFLIKL